ncbi:MAG: CDP-alcohol phosphatidyltransferase family protein [bacterium]
MIPAIMCVGDSICSEKLDKFNNEKIGKIPLYERILINLINEGFNKVYIVTKKNIFLELNNISSPVDIKYIELSDLGKIKEDLLIFQNNIVINKKQLTKSLEEISKTKNSCTCIDYEKHFTGISFVKQNDLNLIKSAKSPKEFEELTISEPPLLLKEGDLGSNKGRDFLFSHISKNVSGWVSKNINSRISIPVSKVLMKFNIHPNTITFFVGCLGISCGLFYASNNPLIGALVLQMATILDRCDGEVARITLKESKFGQWFDTALDQLSYFSMFIGIATCLNNPSFFPLTNVNILIKQFSIINILLYIIFITTVLFFMIRRTSNGSLAYYPGEVDKRVPIEERSLFYRLISKYRFLLKREFFSPAMIFGSFLGYKFLAITALILFIFGLYHQVSDYIALKEKTDITY